MLVVVGGALGWLVGERVADQVPELRDSLGQAVERLPAPLQQGIPNELTPGSATGARSALHWKEVSTNQVE